jgi:hypothetical protein
MMSAIAVSSSTTSTRPRSFAASLTCTPYPRPRLQLLGRCVITPIRKRRRLIRKSDVAGITMWMSSRRGAALLEVLCVEGLVYVMV